MTNFSVAEVCDWWVRLTASSLMVPLPLLTPSSYSSFTSHSPVPKFPSQLSIPPQLPWLLSADATTVASVAYNGNLKVVPFGQLPERNMASLLSVVFGRAANPSFVASKNNATIDDRSPLATLSFTASKYHQSQLLPLTRSTRGASRANPE